MRDDEASATGLQELLDARATPIDRELLSDETNRVVSNILQFWYLGNFNDAPIENRAERFGGLMSHQILPYVTIEAVCKAPAYWALALDLPDRT